MEEKELKIDEAHHTLLIEKLRSRKVWTAQKIYCESRGYRLIAPRKLEGVEERLTCEDSGQVGILFTSWLDEQKKWRARGSDSMWPIITEHKKMVWHGYPCKRTEKGIAEFYTYALIVEHEIYHRPACSICNQMMHCRRIYGTTDYQYVCKANTYHPYERITLPFGFSLPQFLKDFLISKKEAHEKYLHDNERKGIERIPAGLVRKPWIVIEN